MNSITFYQFLLIELALHLKANPDPLESNKGNRKQNSLNSGKIGSIIDDIEEH
jgi:hypothetical protein